MLWFATSRSCSSEVPHLSLLRPQESAEFLDKDGFAHMGDIGYFDNQGLLYFVARAKEMLKVPD